MLLTALIGNEAEQDVIFKAAEDPRHRAAALRALGFVGTARAAEAALPLCRAAGPDRMSPDCRMRTRISTGFVP